MLESTATARGTDARKFILKKARVLTWTVHPVEKRKRKVKVVSMRDHEEISGSGSTFPLILSLGIRRRYEHSKENRGTAMPRFES